MNFFKLYIGDYQRDTAHLSVTEHGAYLLMLQHYYATEKPLPVGKALHRMLRAQDKEEREAIDSVVAQFWTTTEAGLVNERADEELTKAGGQAETNRATAIAREARRKAAREEHDQSTNRATNRSTNDQPNQTPDTRHQKEIHPPTPSGARVHGFPPGFEEFWSAYPKKVGKDAAAKAFAKRRPGQETLRAMLDAIEAQRQSEQWRKNAGQFIPNPATWLNEGRWQDGEPTGSGSIFEGIL